MLVNFRQSLGVDVFFLNLEEVRNYSAQRELRYKFPYVYIVYRIYVEELVNLEYKDVQTRTDQETQEILLDDNQVWLINDWEKNKEIIGLD